MDKNIELIVDEIKQAEKIVILSGAGISTASGIPDFRSRGGIYDKNPEEILSRAHFNNSVNQFYRDYKEILNNLNGDYKPNCAHYFAADLKNLQKDVTVVTQNVDGLYRDVEGLEEEDVIEYHGNAKRLICTNENCNKFHPVSFLNELDLNETFPKCTKCNSILDVDVVLFGDVVKHHIKSQQKVDECDLIVVMGTGLKVYPFYTLYNEKKKSILLNNESIFLDNFNLSVIDDLSVSIPKIQKLIK